MRGCGRPGYPPRPGLLALADEAMKLFLSLPSDDTGAGNLYVDVARARTSAPFRYTWGTDELEGEPEESAGNAALRERLWAA